jgi:hypothetical protein
MLFKNKKLYFWLAKVDLPDAETPTVIIACICFTPFR